MSKAGIPSYPKVYNVGHPAVVDIFEDTVIVEEKVDGSQFSFYKDDEGGLHFRSKGAEVFAADPGKLFAPAVGMAEALREQLVPNWNYRGEALFRPKHNVLAYDRVPTGGFILFDVDKGNELYLTRKEKEVEADRLGIEIVPMMYMGTIKDLEQVLGLMDTTSCLGGQLVEGLVFKNYNAWHKDGKCKLAKHVSERFKEVHRGAGNVNGPKPQGDILFLLAGQLRTEARWDKAVIHLKERGELENSPRDIGNLIKEVQLDIETEEKERLKEELFRWAWKRIRGRLTVGLPEWYKEKLLKEALDA